MSRAEPAPPAEASPWGRAALLPVVWCVWLLAALIPSLLLAPDVTPREWLVAEAAPAAVIVMAALFLAAIWPFWPALAGPPEGLRLRAGWLGRSLVELVMLGAAAVPFVAVAWTVGGRVIRPAQVAVALAVPAALGLGVRIAWAGCGPKYARWIHAVALAIPVGPILVIYAVREVLSRPLPALREACVLVTAMRTALEGTGEGGLSTFLRVGLWPAAGLALALVGLSELAWRRRRAGET